MRRRICMRFSVSLAVVSLVFLAVMGCGGRPSSKQRAQFVGSDSCKGCHDRIYSTWQRTLHARAVLDVSQHPQAIQGDWSQPSDLRTFKKEDVKYTHGVQWKQRYVDRGWHILPAQ